MQLRAFSRSKDYYLQYKALLEKRSQLEDQINQKCHHSMPCCIKQEMQALSEIGLQIKKIKEQMENK